YLSSLALSFASSPTSSGSMPTGTPGGGNMNAYPSPPPTSLMTLLPLLLLLTSWDNKAAAARRPEERLRRWRRTVARAEMVANSSDHLMYASSEDGHRPRPSPLWLPSLLARPGISYH